MILLFWFLILALALAWGIADWQQEQIAARPPPTPTAKVAPRNPDTTVPPSEAVPVPTAEPKDESSADTPKDSDTDKPAADSAVDPVR